MVEKIEVNLIPNEYRIHSKSVKIPKDILLSVLATLIAISVTSGILYWKKQKLDEVNFEINSLTSEIKTLETKEKEIGRLKANQKTFRDMKNGLNSIHVDRDTWIRLLEIYCRELPSNTWLISVDGEELGAPAPVQESSKPKSKSKGKRKSKKKETTVAVAPKGPVKSKVKIKGRTEAFGEVGQFMARLQETPNIENVTVIEVKSATNNKNSFDFEIVHVYNPPKAEEVAVAEKKSKTKSKRKRKGK